MGRAVDLNSPLSEIDKEYLRSRGRGYLILANERRFGPDGKRKPEEHEKAGAPSQSPFYDTQERDRAVYDRGGAPLPGTTLDYDTGRAFDRVNGVLVEPALPTTSPGQFATRLQEPEGFESYDEEESDIDEDIAEEVTGYTVAELKAKLDKAKVEYSSGEHKADLQDKLAIHLQDKRDGRK